MFKSARFREALQLDAGRYDTLLDIVTEDEAQMVWTCVRRTVEWVHLYDTRWHCIVRFELSAVHTPFTTNTWNVLWRKYERVKRGTKNNTIKWSLHFLKFEKKVSISPNSPIALSTGGRPYSDDTHGIAGSAKLCSWNAYFLTTNAVVLWRLS